MTDDTVIYGDQPPQPPSYPVSFEVTAPAEVSRLSTAFRIVLMIPLLFAVAIIGTGGWFTPYITVGFGLSGGLVLFHWITILVRGRPVGWVFDVLVAMQRFIIRANTYFMLVTDKYPPFEGEWAVSYDVERPERLRRRQLVIWKTLASIPHFIVLALLWFAVAVCVLIAWFAILFTGRYPLGLRGFVVGWLRWSARVNAYWISLRDDFPPFSLSEETGPATSTAHVVSGVGGFVLAGGAIGGIVALIIATASTNTVDVSYAALQNGEPSETAEIIDLEFTLLGADDDYVFDDELFVPELGDRFVLFVVEVFNGSDADHDIFDHEFAVKDTAGDRHDASLVSYGGLVGPRQLPEGARGFLQTIFEVPVGEGLDYFEYEGSFLQKARFEFTE